MFSHPHENNFSGSGNTTSEELRAGHNNSPSSKLRVERPPFGRSNSNFRSPGEYGHNDNPSGWRRDPRVPPNGRPGTGPPSAMKSIAVACAARMSKKASPWNRYCDHMEFWRGLSERETTSCRYQLLPTDCKRSEFPQLTRRLCHVNGVDCRRNEPIEPGNPYVTQSHYNEVDCNNRKRQKGSMSQNF